MAKPTITVREASPFGDVDADYVESPDKDLFDMPGYSDKRIARELAIRDGGSQAPLEFRLQGVRTSKIDGSPDRRKEQEYRARGYEPLTVERAKALGLDLDNSAYIAGADGSVQLNEYVMFVATREVAARDNKKLNDRNKRQQEEPQEKMREAVEAFNAEAGLKSDAGGAEAVFELE
jgi:hypothetical protein